MRIAGLVAGCTSRANDVIMRMMSQ